MSFSVSVTLFLSLSFLAQSLFLSYELLSLPLSHLYQISLSLFFTNSLKSSSFNPNLVLNSMNSMFKKKKLSNKPLNVRKNVDIQCKNVWVFQKKNCYIKKKNSKVSTGTKTLQWKNMRVVHTNGTTKKNDQTKTIPPLPPKRHNCIQIVY